MANKKMKPIDFVGFRTIIMSGKQPAITIPMNKWKKSNIPKGQSVLVELKITPISPKELVKKKRR